MSWKEITIYTTNEAEEAVANVLNDFGANGVIVEDIRDVTKEKENKFGEIIAIDTSRFPESGIYIKAYFFYNDGWTRKKEQIYEAISNLTTYGIDIGSWQLSEDTVEEQDWENEWKKYFTVQKVSKNITIVPSWEEDHFENGLSILIDPGMAFGTGTHPTTMLSLQALEDYISPNDVVLDVGIGSGVLSIAACKLRASHVYGYDLDEVAVKSAKMNRDLNKLQDSITIQQHDLLRDITNTSHMIVANILADILIDLISDAWDNLHENGYFITSGIIKKKEHLVKEKLIKKGFEILETRELENWITIIAQKRK